MSKKSAQRHTYLCNNKLALVSGGRPYFDLLEQLIDGAQESIHIQTYVYDEDETGIGIGQALLRAASRGVKVFVLVDAYASQHLSNHFVDTLRKGGVRFMRFQPLFKSRRFYLGRRLHHKVSVFDGKQALVAGINISDKYKGTNGNPPWMDWAVHVEGEVAAQLEVICARRAKVDTGEAITKNKHLPIVAQRNCPVRIRVNDWVRGYLDITRSYIKMFRAAQSEIIIMSSYFLPGREFRRNLRRAAKRGVKIKLILAGKSDVDIAKNAERYLYPGLMRHKIEIYEYQPSILHGKMTVCDGQWSTIGSYNLNDISAQASIELNLEIMDTAFVQEATARLKAIIEKDCRQITADEYRHRTHFWSRVKQRAAYNIFRFLFFLFTFYFKQRQSPATASI